MRKYHCKIMLEHTSQSYCGLCAQQMIENILKCYQNRFTIIFNDTRDSQGCELQTIRVHPEHLGEEFLSTTQRFQTQDGHMEDSDSQFMRLILSKPFKNSFWLSKFGIVASQRNLLSLFAGCASHCCFLYLSLEAKNSSVVQITVLKERHKEHTVCSLSAFFFSKNV